MRQHVGDENCANTWGPAEIDRQFSDAILLPGFVEGHAHLMAGAMWHYTNVGFHDRTDPDGKLWRGCSDASALVTRLKDFASGNQKNGPVVGWGFDPMFLQSDRLNRHHLDEICRDRPVAVIYSNFHLMCANTKALELAGYFKSSKVPGVLTDENGHPTGELQEMAAMFSVLRRLSIDFQTLSHQETSIRSFGKIANRAGVTTIKGFVSDAEGGGWMVQVVGQSVDIKTSKDVKRTALVAIGLSTRLTVQQCEIRWASSGPSNQRSQRKS